MATSWSALSPISARLALAESGRKNSYSARGTSVRERCNQTTNVMILMFIGAIFFKWDVSSAISFATVLIHWELMPSGELMISEQKKRARQQPVLDFRQAPVVQIRADVLLVMLRRTGCYDVLVDIHDRQCLLTVRAKRWRTSSR